MRRAAFLMACVLGFSTWATQVPATAQAGFDSPTHIAGPMDRAKDAVVPYRCPRVANPIECNDWGSGEGRDHGHGDHDVRTPHHGTHEDRARMQCVRDRDVYMLHHWEDGPRTCAAYARDAAYHSTMRRAHVDASAAEGLEALISAVRGMFDRGTL